ncbi:MAG TPA: thioredoxin domain-containing protein, partial [Kofleriaceae bacterium]
MKTLSTVFLACSLLAACQNDSKLDSGSGAKPSGDLESRVKKLEADAAKHAEALEFLDKVYAQQKQQADSQEREEPAPDAIFAVDITPDLKAGQVEGPANAPVTIVEAFDFACPYCRQVSDTLESLVKSYNGKVRVVF